MRRVLYLAGTAACVTVMALFPAQAQERVDRAPTAANARSGSDVILVTARKREETIADIPLAITAFSEEALEARGVEDIEELSAFAPGFNYSKQGNQRGGRAESVVRFRGMDINDFAPTKQLASVFIDGIYVAGGVSSISFEDVARVEVIKGPQSAYFGRSTFGGAVNFISKSPGAEPGVDFVASLASGWTRDISLSLEGGLGSDRVRARVTGRFYGTEGRYRSIADGGKLGEEETRSLNLILDADPADTLRLRARAFIGKDEDGPPTTFALTRDMHNCGPFPGGTVTYFCGRLPKVEEFGVNTILPPAAVPIYVNNSRNSAALARGPGLDHLGLKRETQRYSLGADLDIAAIDAVLSGIVGYNEVDQERLLDLDFTPQPIWLENRFDYVEDWSGELRLAGSSGAFDWLGGMSYFKLRYDAPNGSIGLLLPRPAFPNGFFLNQTIGRTDVETIAGFGSLAWRFADEFTLNLEGRYQEESIDQGEVAGIDLAETFSNFLPRVILQWQPSEATNLYVSYAKGNKPGDFNTSVVGLTPAQKQEVRDQTGATDTVGEEELDSYEVGLKQGLLGGRINLNLAAYYMQWKNQQNRTQAVITDPTTPAGIRFVPVVISAGKTDLWGIEAEASAELTREVTLTGTFNWAASKYIEFDCGFCARVTGTADVSGNQSPRFPEFSGTLGLAYDGETAGGLGLFGRLDAIYTAGAWTEAFNLARPDDAVRVNVRAGVRFDQVQVEAFITNLLDDDTYLAAARFTDFTKGNFNLNDFVVNVTPAEPRAFGTRVRLNF